MTRVHVLEFDEHGSPRNPQLFEAAREFCKQFIAVPVDLRGYQRVWVSVEGEGDEMHATGILAGEFIPDFPLVRFTNAKAVKRLYETANEELLAMGLRGHYATVFMKDGESEQDRCPQWREWLEALGAISAERYKLKIV